MAPFHPFRFFKRATLSAWGRDFQLLNDQRGWHGVSCGVAGGLALPSRGTGGWAGQVGPSDHFEESPDDLLSDPRTGPAKHRCMGRQAGVHATRMGGGFRQNRISSRSTTRSNTDPSGPGAWSPQRTPRFFFAARGAHGTVQFFWGTNDGGRVHRTIGPAAPPRRIVDHQQYVGRTSWCWRPAKRQGPSYGGDATGARWPQDPRDAKYSIRRPPMEEEVLRKNGGYWEALTKLVPFAPRTRSPHGCRPQNRCGSRVPAKDLTIPQGRGTLIGMLKNPVGVRPITSTAGPRPPDRPATRFWDRKGRTHAALPWTAENRPAPL